MRGVKCSYYEAYNLYKGYGENAMILLAKRKEKCLFDKEQEIYEFFFFFFE